MLIALACVIDGEAVKIFVTAEGRAVVQLALKAYRLRLGIALGKGRLDRVIRFAYSSLVMLCPPFVDLLQCFVHGKMVLVIAQQPLALHP